MYFSSPPFYFSTVDIIELVPQIVLAHDALDNQGNPLSFESFGFQPDVVLKRITKDEFIRFMIYMLEYKMLVLEQMAHEREVIYTNVTFPKLLTHNCMLEKTRGKIYMLPRGHQKTNWLVFETYLPLRLFFGTYRMYHNSYNKYTIYNINAKRWHMSEG